MSARHRRWLPSAVAAALVALAVAAPHGRAAAPALSRSAPPIVTRKLPNGLTVILVEDRRAPLVSVVALYRAGSADDPPDRPGLAHLLEHAVIEGAPPIARGAAREGEGEGLYLTTGLTTVDETFYRQEVRTGEVAVALWREAMRLTAFERRADVERALPLAAESVINEEGGRVDRSPLLDGIRAATALFLGQQHPYAISLGSESTTARTASVAELEDFHTRHYTPENATVALVGDIDVEQISGLVERYLGPVPAATADRRVTARAPAPVERRLRVTADVPRPLAIFVYPTPPRFAADDAALSLVPALLGAAPGGRLHQRLVRDQHVASSVSVQYAPHRLGGWLVVGLEAPDGHSPEPLVAAFDREVASWRGGWPTAAELGRVHAALALDRVSRFELFEERAMALLEAHDLGGAARAVWTFAGKQASASTEEVQAAAGRILGHPVRLVMLVDPASGRDRPPLPSPPPPATGPPPPPVHRTTRTTIPAPIRSGAPLSSAQLSGPPLETFTLSNGLPVIVSPSHEVPRVDATLVVRAGDAAAPPAAMGLAQATAALLVHGSRRHDDAAFDEQLDAIGASVDARTGWAAAEVSFEVATPYLDRAVALWTEAVREPAFDGATLARWRRGRLVARRRMAADPVAAAADALQRRLYAVSSPYSRAGGGTTATLPAVTVEAVRRFHQERYHPGNATVVVVGDVDPSALRRLLERTLGDWKAQPPPERAPPPPTTVAAGPALVLVDVPGRRQAAITIGTLGLTGWPAQQAMNQVMDQMLERRLSAALHRAGLAYILDVAVDLSAGSNLFQARALVPSGHVGEALRTIRAEMDHLRTDRSAWSPLPAFRGAAVQSLYRRLESTDGIEGSLLGAVMASQAPRPLSQDAVEYEAVPASDLQALTAATLAPGRLVTVVAGDRAVLEPQLAGLGPVQVVSPAP